MYMRRFKPCGNTFIQTIITCAFHICIFITIYHVSTHSLSLCLCIAVACYTRDIKTIPGAESHILSYDLVREYYSDFYVYRVCNRTGTMFRESNSNIKKIFCNDWGDWVDDEIHDCEGKCSEVWQKCDNLLKHFFTRTQLILMKVLHIVPIFLSKISKKKFMILYASHYLEIT